MELFRESPLSSFRGPTIQTHGADVHGNGIFCITMVETFLTHHIISFHFPIVFSRVYMIYAFLSRLYTVRYMYMADRSWFSTSGRRACAYVYVFFNHVAESVVWSLARATAQRNRSQFGRQSLLHKLLAAGSENVYVCVCARVLIL